MSKATHSGMADVTGEREAGYVHYFKPAPADIEFEKSLKFDIIKTVEEFRRITEGISDKTVAFDSETKTLDFSEKDPIVGVSFALSGLQGYYIPFRHLVGLNAPLILLKEFHEFLLRNKVLGFNTPFDVMMMQAEGFPADEYKIFEVMSLVFNADTNIKKNGLKDSSLHFLGRKAPTFEEVVGKGATFNHITPEDGAYYAVCDAVNTFALFEKLFPVLNKECPAVLKIDAALSKVMPFYLSQEIEMDTSRMKQLGIEIKTRIQALEIDIFRVFGFMFLLDSNRQLSQALLSIGVDTGTRTRLGDMVVDEEALTATKHPVAELIVERNSLTKQLGSYVEKFSEKPRGRVNYQIFRVPTGRTASGNKDNPYFLKLNFQNLTKPGPGYYRVEPCTDSNNILGHQFISVPKKEVVKKANYVEALSGELNVRTAITCPEPKDEWLFVSVDFVQEELKVAAMLSRDPVMLKAYRNNEDLHTRVAIEMFGEANFDQEKRKKAKVANFGLLFDGSAFTLERSSKLPLADCEAIYQQYWTTMKGLRAWKRQIVSICYRKGGVTHTVYGRPRRLTYYLSNPLNKLKRFGERSITSHIVQGSCGDVMRIVLVKLKNNIFGPYGRDVIRFCGCVHDEIVFCVRKTHFHEILPKMRELMAIQLPNCEMPLGTSVEVGTSYGMMWGFEVNKGTGVWEPAYV